MKKKMIRLFVMPALAAISFVSFSSFVGAAETPPPTKCFDAISGHDGPVVLGIVTIICDGSGSKVCLVQKPCP